MSRVSLAQAQVMLDAGRPATALDLAWKAVRPAVLRQDNDEIRVTLQFAEQVALNHDGDIAAEAERLSSYCAACIAEPRDNVPSMFSMGRLFGRGARARKSCPDCAEQIQPDAKVCRYCGHRYPTT